MSLMINTSDVDPRVRALEQAVQSSMIARQRWIDDYRYSLDLYRMESRRVFGWQKFAPATWAQIMDPVVYEYVQYYLPVLFSANPHRNFTGMGSSPFNDAIANVLEDYGKWSTIQYKGWKEYRKNAKDLLLSGQAALWSRVNRRLGCVINERVDPLDVLIDPDVVDPDHARFIMRRYIAPMHEIRALFPQTSIGMRPNVVASNDSTYWFDDSKFQTLGTNEQVNHLGCYYVVYSKMGDFSVAKSVSPDVSTNTKGDYWYIVFAPGHDRLLEARQGWPNAVLQQEGDYPLTLYGHHFSPDMLWPMCPAKPVFPLERFLSWAWSFLMMHMRTAALTKVALNTDAFKDAEEAIEALKSSVDFDALEMSELGDSATIQNVISYIQKPALNSDFFQSIMLASQRRAEVLGLSPILRGQTDTQIRSAQDSFNKDRNSRVPIEDMAAGFVEFLGEATRKEAMLISAHVPSETVVTDDFVFIGMDTFSPLHKLVWDRRQRDVRLIAKEYTVEIAAGTTQRKDKQEQIGKATQLSNLTAQLLGTVGDIADPQSTMDVANMAVAELAKAFEIDTTNTPQLKISQAVVANEQAAAQATGQGQPGQVGPPTGEIPLYDSDVA